MQDTDQSITSGQTSIPEPDSHVMGRRFVALLIDSLILAFIMSWSSRAFGTAHIGTNTSAPGIISAIGGELYNIPIGSGGTISTTSWVINLSLLLQLIYVFLYFTLQESFFGATIGKMIMKLRVISQDNDITYTQLTLKAALLRNLIRFIDASGSYLLGALVCACSPRRRRLGDMVAQTLVVREESVPSLGMSGQRVRYGGQVMILLCLLIAIGSPIFAYFWQPPIFIQNNITVEALYPSDHITSYTLGEKSWGHNQQGQQIVSYPIDFISKYLPTNKTHECKGVVTLAWQWSMLSWQQDPSSMDVTCHDQ